MPHMAPITVLHANLALTCVGSVLYGIFFVLTVTSLVVLVARRSKNPNGTSSFNVGRTLLSSPLVIGTLLLFITVGGHWCTTIIRLFQSTDYEGGQHMEDYYIVVELAPRVVATGFVIASVIVGDIILIYRVWIVCSKKIVTVIFPALCTCAYIGIGISIVRMFTTFKPGENVFIPALKRQSIASTALTLLTNVYGTGCITYRIWSTSRMVRHERASATGMGLSEIFVIFVESAALHTSWIFFFLVSYIASSPLETFAFHCIPTVTGISFMLIIVRVGLGFSWAEPASSSLSLTPIAHLTVLNLTVTWTVEREAVTDFALPRVGHKGDEDSDSAQDAGSECV